MTILSPTIAAAAKAWMFGGLFSWGTLRAAILGFPALWLVTLLVGAIQAIPAIDRDWAK